MTRNTQKFADMLAQALYRIRSLELKSLASIQDELGYAVGRESGGAYIQYLRKFPGNTPSHFTELEALATEIARRTDFEWVWWVEFLQSAGHPDPGRMCSDLHLLDEQRAQAIGEKQSPEAEDYLQEAPPHVFVVGRPVVHPRHFFGRQQETRRVMGLWKQRPFQHVAVIGPRRSGKTSLMYYLMNISRVAPNLLRNGQRGDWLPHPVDYRWIYVDFQDPRMRRAHWLYRHILSELDLPAPEVCDLSLFVDLMARRQQRPTVILMDEVEAALTSPELDLEFWWAMRSLGIDAKGMLAFAIATLDLPEQQAQDVGKPSPFFNIFHTLHLGPLCESEADELVNSSPIPFPVADVEWVLQQSRRWPSLLQILCHVRLLALEENQAGEQWKEIALRQIAPYRHLLQAR
jgi:hypothetical protein